MFRPLVTFHMEPQISLSPILVTLLIINDSLADLQKAKKLHNIPLNFSIFVGQQFKSPQSFAFTSQVKSSDIHTALHGTTTVLFTCKALI